MKAQFSLFKLFALLPFIGIALFLAHTQYHVSTGSVYRVKIKGYDPRDLLHGRYLRYSFDLPTRNPAHKHIFLSKANYCFIQLPNNLQRIDIMPYESSLDGCSSVVKHSKLKGSHKYFIPEKYAKDLENKLRDNQVSTSVDLIITKYQNFTVGQLYLNDQPWEDLLIKSKSTK